MVYLIRGSADIMCVVLIPSTTEMLTIIVLIGDNMSFPALESKYKWLMWDTGRWHLLPACPDEDRVIAAECRRFSARCTKHCAVTQVLTVK